MTWIFELLRAQPFLALLLVGWVLSALGGMLKRTAKRGEARRLREAAPSPAQTTAQPPTPPQRRRPSSEEVAAEMRRILGMDAPPAAAPRRQPPPPPPVRRAVVAPAIVPPPPKPATRIGELQARLEQQAPMAAGIGARTMGTLGGREIVRQQLRRASTGLVNLNDLPRLFVMAEVLGKPLALRDNW